MKCLALEIGAKPELDALLAVPAACRHSSYAFANLYVWRALYEVCVAGVESSKCVFFRDALGCFMPIPPLGGELTGAVLDEAFAYMDGFNANRDISRIENVPQQFVPRFEQLGYAVAPKPGDYLCETESIARLSGNKLKHKRASANQFIANNRYQVRAYAHTHKDACLALYSAWMQERRQHVTDPVYTGMLEDSFKTLSVALQDADGLGITGLAVEVDGSIKGFTLGCPVCADTFCIMYEVADLSCRGISQFIFQEFARHCSGFRYLNIMDDSGLANLARVKASFHPCQIVPAFIATRKQ